MKTKSKSSQRREQKQNSPETLEFKIKINEFLKNAKPEIIIKISNK